MKLTVYVDGSYNSNGHVYGGGVVVLVPGIDKPLEQKVAGNDPNYARLRNVAGEVLATMTALQIAKQVSCTELEIYYDYAGIENWILSPSHPNSWKAKNNFSKAYKTVMLEAMQTIKVKFIKVKAHSGDYYNELADKLAKEAVRGE